MTPEQHRECAAEIMRYNAGRADPMVVCEQVEDFVGRANLPYSPDHDVTRVVDLIRDATVTITWPDPCPACGVVGCTEHPTWAAESASATIGPPSRVPSVSRFWSGAKSGPELAEWERELLARQAAESEPDPLPEPLRMWANAMVESLRPFAEAFDRLAADIRATLIEPKRNDPPKPAGYSETLTIPGTDEAVDGCVCQPENVTVPGAVHWTNPACPVHGTTTAASITFVYPPSGGLERVVTAQDPGGLLSVPETPVAPLPVATPNDTPGSVDDPL